MAVWSRFFQKERMEPENRRLSELEQLRTETRQRILAIRADMELWVRKGIDADELDRRIYAMEYSSRKMELDSELEHFDDLTNAIIRLKKSMLVTREKLEIDRVMDERSKFDREGMLRRRDYIQACRELEKEADEEIGEAEEHEPYVSPEIDSEYLRMVARMNKPAAAKE